MKDADKAAATDAAADRTARAWLAKDAGKATAAMAVAAAKARFADLPTEPPAWYDPIKFQRGQEFSRRHFAGVSLAHFVSLLAALNAPQILKVIIHLLHFYKFIT